MPTVAVVGAGLSGLTCARSLAEHGFPVTVYDKSRGVGGRMATRRTETGLKFDHGAQYFTARDSAFCRYVNSWIDVGIVMPWEGRIVVLEQGKIMGVKSGTDRFVAVPQMNAICKHLSTGLNIEFQTSIEPLERKGKQWRIADDKGTTLGLFDVAVVSAPAGQTAELLREVPSLAVRAREPIMHGCWAVMLAFPSSLELDFEGAFVHSSPLSWIARNSSKPGRNAEAETWVLHASAEWTHAHLEEPAELIAQLLTAEFWRAVGLSATRAYYSMAHRWRHALPVDSLAESCLFDREMQLAACGDWCGGPRVEGAFLSGASAAEQVKGLLKTDLATTVPRL